MSLRTLRLSAISHYLRSGLVEVARWSGPVARFLVGMLTYRQSELSIGSIDGHLHGYSLREVGWRIG